MIKTWWSYVFACYGNVHCVCDVNLVLCATSSTPRCLLFKEDVACHMASTASVTKHPAVCFMTMACLSCSRTIIAPDRYDLVSLTMNLEKNILERKFRTLAPCRQLFFTILCAFNGPHHESLPLRLLWTAGKLISSVHLHLMLCFFGMYTQYTMLKIYPGSLIFLNRV